MVCLIRVPFDAEVVAVTHFVRVVGGQLPAQEGGHVVRLDGVGWRCASDSRRGSGDLLGGGTRCRWRTRPDPGSSGSAPPSGESPDNSAPRIGPACGAVSRPASGSVTCWPTGPSKPRRCIVRCGCNFLITSTTMRLTLWGFGEGLRVMGGHDPDYRPTPDAQFSGGVGSAPALGTEPAGLRRARRSVQDLFPGSRRVSHDLPIRELCGA